MSQAPAVNLEDLSPEVRRRMKLRKPREQSMTRNEVRTYALRVLAVIADMTPGERRRVLRQANLYNER